MKVRAEDIDAELGNNGITLHIADNGGKHIGTLRFDQAKLRWSKARTKRGPKGNPDRVARRAVEIPTDKEQFHGRKVRAPGGVQCPGIGPWLSEPIGYATTTQTASYRGERPMGLELENLDEKTRQHMLSELEYDPDGEDAYPTLLRKAIEGDGDNPLRDRTLPFHCSASRN